MTQYIVILLDDTAVSFCHYDNEKQERSLMPLCSLRDGIRYAMKENLNIQFVYPDYALPTEYNDLIDSVDHAKIKPAAMADDADVVVLNGIDEADGFGDYKASNVSYVLRLSRKSFFAHTAAIAEILHKVSRLNVVFTDIDFTDDDFKAYSSALKKLSEEVEQIYIEGKSVQFNLLTDRIMLNQMNNCRAGDTTITLAPDGKFYVCPAFYFDKDGFETGDLASGPRVKNPQLYKLDHAPLCRHCDAYQCKRCIWLNWTTTLEVNTPSHEQCVAAHLERNASRDLLRAIRQHGTFMPEQDDIKEINYLDPFDEREKWHR